ncbi:MAG: hypothetical protein M1825_004615 [Sarcosagium campestre]|nr:MAG: hypothetical protein M1825_004615 [Sarcosagium campestre]
MFSRRHRNHGDATATSAAGGPAAPPHTEPKHGRRGQHGTTTAISTNSRPSFGQWLKVTWLDIVTMIAMGAIGLGVYEANPAPTRSFAVYFQDGEIVYPEFAYPLRKEVIPIWAAAMLAALVPIFVFLICQIRVRSFWDVNNAVLGLLYSLITAAVFQVFLKWLIGGLRPHFLAVCKPTVQPNGLENGNGLRQIYYDRSICTGDENEINDSLESFPSGHTTAAFAGFVFLYLYLNAKLKVFANYHPAMWKLVAIYAPILGAVLIGGALTIDEFHNWYDILAGAVIGTVMAFSAYRMVYASVWDFRFNHIPLTRHEPFSYSQFELTSSPPFTHRAGWGLADGAAAGGAPFDSSAAAAGGGGFNGVSGGNGGIAPTHQSGNGYSHNHGHSIDRRPVGTV